MNLGPMTWIVLFVLAALVVVGVTILARSGEHSGSPQCTRCKHINRKTAKFCARCGQALGE
jgi:hypothetical protein